MFKKFRDFILDKIWKKKINKLSKPKRFYYKSIKIFLISTYHFFKHELILRASALTYFSLMAIVPFFALIFVFAREIGYQEKIEAELIEKFKDQKELINRVVEFSKNLIFEAKGGLIALVGTIFLFWSLIILFTNLEISLNEIWNVDVSKKIKRRFGNYLALMFITPIITVIFFSLKIYILTFISKNILEQDFLNIIIKVLPYLLILALFIFIYSLIPLVKVKFRYALYSALIASGIYQIVQTIYVHFQVQLTRFNAIYGSFAALPLFLIWLQISWIIFFYGAELCYSFQNVDKLSLVKLRKK